jgi:FkbM family methyltransferase
MLAPVRRLAGRALRAAKRRLGTAHAPAPEPASLTSSRWSDPQFPMRKIVELGPDVVLDVGANEGQFVDWLRAAGYGGRVVSFEPQRAVFEALARRAAAQPCWECHRVALGAAAGSLPMHVSAFSLSSSLLPIGKLHVDLMPQTAEVGIEEVPVVRLDEWAGAAELVGKRIFLKLDVQGFELPVIQGAAGLLPYVEGALVELDFATLYDGQSKYYEVMSALEAAGLRFVGLSGANVHPVTADILWADAFFERVQRSRHSGR